jgi:putative FmdB family regulatory protein
MPVYEYRCENEHTFEVVQRMSDDPLSTCTVCGAPVQRVFHPVAVHFKGSGFYTTDYGRRKSSGGASSDDTGSGSDPGDKKDSKATDGASAKSDSGSSGSDSGSSGSDSGSGGSGSSGSGD